MGTISKERIYAWMAALCLAICAFYRIGQKIFIMIQYNYSSITWDFVVYGFVQLGFIVLLVIAKKNIGFLFFTGIDVLMNLYYLVLWLSIGNLCAFVAAVMLFLIFLFNIILNVNNNVAAAMTVTKALGIISVIMRFAGVLIDWVQWHNWVYVSNAWIYILIQIVSVVAVLFIVIWLTATLNTIETDIECYPCATYNTQNVNVQFNGIIGGADKLRFCKELLDSGAITQEEFEKRKKEILRS